MSAARERVYEAVTERGVVRQFELLVCLVVLILGLSTVYSVPEGSVGVLQRPDGRLDVKNSGIHLKFPFVDRLTVVSTELTTLWVTFTGRTKDHVRVAVKLGVTWGVDPEGVLKLFAVAPRDYVEQLVKPAMSSEPRDVLAEFSYEEISERKRFSTRLADALEERLVGDGIRVHAVSLEDIRVIPDPKPASYDFERRSRILARFVRNGDRVCPLSVEY